MSLKVQPKDLAEAKSLLATLVEMQGVSFPESPQYSLETLTKLAHVVGEKFQELSFQVSYFPKKGIGPYVLAERHEKADLPTLLFYMHYDVQPVDLAQWATNPFRLEEKDSRLYGRGASDDQGGIVAVWTALKVHLAAKKEFGFNLKVLIEGDEEYGATDIGDFIKERKQELQADALIVMDGMNSDINTGTLQLSTRGIVTLHLKVEALKQPTHSGIGCIAPDPIQYLASLISSLSNPLLVKGFMEGATPYTAKEREFLQKSSIAHAQYAKDAGMLNGTKLRGDPTHTVFEQVALAPSITVLHMQSGKANGPNVVQPSAECSIQARILPGQDPAQVQKSLQDYLEKVDNPTACQLSISPLGLPAKGWKGRTEGPIFQKYMDAISANFPRSALMPTGGTLPLLSEFQEQYPRMEILVPGVEDPDTSAHSHNESQDLQLWERVMNTLLNFFDRIAMPK